MLWDVATVRGKSAQTLTTVYYIICYCKRIQYLEELFCFLNNWE